MTNLSKQEMTGKPLKHPRPYVFVAMDPVKHLYLGEQPNEGDSTACGIKIEGKWRWAQRAVALPATRYCRDCERIVNETLKQQSREAPSFSPNFDERNGIV